MKKIFNTSLDIGKKDSSTFRDFNGKLSKLASSYQNYYKKALELMKYSNPKYSRPETLQFVLSQNRDLVTSKEFLNENKGIIQAASQNAFRSFQKLSAEQLEDLIKDNNLYTYFFLESTEIFVNAGAYLIIPYNGDKQIKVRLVDDYIPRGYYPKAKFLFNGKKWIVSLQSSQDEEAFKIKKFRINELNVLLCEDGSLCIGERDFPSILENEEVQEIWESLGEKWKNYNREKALLKGKTNSSLITQLREINNLKRRCKDSNRGYYLSLIVKLIKSCPKELYLSSSADFNSSIARKVDLALFVRLLEQATSLYGIELELRLKYPIERKCVKC